MAALYKIINKYLDLCDTSSYSKLATENKTKKKKTIVDAYSETLIKFNKDAILNKFFDIYCSIQNQDPLYLLDAVILYISNLPESHPDMALLVKEKYIDFRNAIGSESINEQMAIFYDAVFKTITGYDIPGFYDEKTIRSTWYKILADSYLILPNFKTKNVENERPATSVTPIKFDTSIKNYA